MTLAFIIAAVLAGRPSRHQNLLVMSSGIIVSFLSGMKLIGTDSSGRECSITEDSQNLKVSIQVNRIYSISL